MSMCNTSVSIAYPNPDNVPFNSPNIPPIVIVQLTSPIIPNLRDMTDSLQWHAMLDMLQYADQDTLKDKVGDSWKDSIFYFMQLQTK